MKDIIETHGNKLINAPLSVLVFTEENSFIAYAPALKLSTYGDSINDAKEAFEDLIQSCVRDCSKIERLEWVIQ